MNALVKLHAEPGLWLADVPEPECGINDVLIRVLRTGICGTDLHIRNWDAWASRTIPVPMVIGHEFVGEVVDRSARTFTDFHPGEVVSAVRVMSSAAGAATVWPAAATCARTHRESGSTGRARSPS